MEFILASLGEIYAVICLGLVYLGWRASPDRAFIAALLVFLHWFVVNYFNAFDMLDGWRLQFAELLFAALLLWASIHLKYELFGFLALILAIRSLWDASYDFLEFQSLTYKWGAGLLFCVEIGRVAYVSVLEVRAKSANKIAGSGSNSYEQS